MSDGFVTPLKSVLTCPGCKKAFNDTDKRPKFLACFHTACLACITKRMAKGKITCPVCNTPTDATDVTALPDNLQLCTILLNMSSLNLCPDAPKTVRDTCPTHCARINFWCDTCRMPLCRDCTVLAHRQSTGHKVRDHDEAMKSLTDEGRIALSDTRTLYQETKRLRLDHRKYLMRQIEACRSFEKQLKAELKMVDNEKKEDCKHLDKLELDLRECKSLLTLHQTAEKAAQLRTVAAKEFGSAKSIVAEKILTFGKLNRSIDDLDSTATKGSSGSRSPSSPSHGHERRSRSLARRFLSNGKSSSKKDAILSQFSLEAPPTYVAPLPRVYLDFSIQGIDQHCRVVCELHCTKAPQICENFMRLCSGSKGFGYKGSQIFRCLPGWWIQGGDIQTNDGEGGKSAMDENFIPAEHTGLDNRPGALEMCCVGTNKKGDLMIASQFFIHIKKYSYTHVFGYVIDGLDMITRISQFGDPNEVYRPTKKIQVIDSGILK